MGLRNFHVEEFDAEAPTTVGIFRHETIRIGPNEIEQTRKRTVSRGGTHSTATLEIRAGSLEIMLSPDDSFAKGTNAILINDGSFNRIGRDVDGVLEKEEIPFKDQVEYQYVLGIEPERIWSLADTKQDRMHLAYALLSAACFGINPERTTSIGKLYEKIGENVNKIPLFSEVVTPMSRVLEEVARVLELDPQTGSIVLVRSKNLVYGLDQLLNGVLQDRVIEPNEKDEVLDYLRDTVSSVEVRENTPLAAALSEVIIQRIRGIYQNPDQRRRIDHFLEDITYKVRDHVLTLEELAQIEFDLGRVKEDDPIKMALQLVKEMKFHGVENALSDLNLPPWAEDALLLVYKLEYMKPGDIDTRRQLLIAYDSMEGNKDIPLSKRGLLREHLASRSYTKTTEWNNIVAESRSVIEAELGRPYTGSEKDLADLRVREQYDLADTCEKAGNSLLKECAEDLEDLALARQHLLNYNRYNGRMNVNKLVDLNRVKKRLDALDKDLFSELIIGHVRDELGGYINPGCLLLEERSKDSTDFEQLIADPSLYDPFIDQLNTTPENQYTGKRKILQLERPFRVLGWAERSERAFELTEMLLGISRVHGKGDDWEGLSREEFNEQFSKGSYVVGNTYSVTSEGTIHIDPQGMDDEIQRRVGVGVAVLEGVLNGEKDIKFRFLE